MRTDVAQLRLLVFPISGNSMAWGDVLLAGNASPYSTVIPDPIWNITDYVSRRLQSVDVNEDLETDACLALDIGFDLKGQLHVDKSVPTMTSSEDPFSLDEDGDTNLHISIIQCEPNLALSFINMAQNSESIDIQNALLQTPLHLAVITRQVEIVRRLMTLGASLDSRDSNGNTPLHIASSKGYDDVVEYLLTPVRFEETVNNTFHVDYHPIPQDLTLKNYDGLTCLHLAGLASSLRSMDALISAGADVNVGDGKSGRTLLHYSVENGDRILLHYLLMWKQTNVNCLTYGGLSPLALASGRGYSDIVSILIQNGAYQDSEPNEQDDNDI